MPYYSRIIPNSFYNRLFPKLFRHNRRMPNREGFQIPAYILATSQLLVSRYMPATY